MKYSELAPGEKFMGALFGDRVGGVRHFFGDEQQKAVNDLLDEFVGEDPSLTAGIKVIRLRFGFDARTEEEKAHPHSSDARTLGEVGAYFSVTGERIRQIEAKTLRMLRHSRYSSRLGQYLEGR